MLLTSRYLPTFKKAVFSIGSFSMTEGERGAASDCHEQAEQT